MTAVNESDLGMPSLRRDGLDSVITRHDSTSTYEGRTPSTSSASSSSKDASAASNV